MTPVVIDASVGVELVADTIRGRDLRSLLPHDAVPWVPDLFYAECGSVLRRWDRQGFLSGRQLERAIRDLLSWPVHVVQTRGLFADAWGRRENVTFTDGLHVALAEHLHAALLTDDHRLARAPLPGLRMLVLPR